MKFTIIVLPIFSTENWLGSAQEQYTSEQKKTVKNAEASSVDFYA